MLDEKRYYFMETKEFKEYFGRDKKQLPVSFSAPVLYVNTHMVPAQELPEDFTSLDQLEVEGMLSVCVGAKDREMYREAFGAGKDPAFGEAKPGGKGL